jgi:hypothetical protein
LIAIFGPEVVVLSALDQWISAKQFLSGLREPRWKIDQVSLKRLCIEILIASCALTQLRNY